MIRKNFLFTCALLCSQISPAQFIGFENGIPEQFQTSGKGKAALSTQYYKEGSHSLEWNFTNSGSILNIALEKPITLTKQTENSAGITLWIYNEKASTRLRSFLSSFLRKGLYLIGSVSGWHRPDGAPAG